VERVADLAIPITIIVAAWILQILLSYRQAMAFGRRVAQMRRSGTVSVGLGRGRLRARTYAVVAVGRDDRVVAAEVLKGWSTLSKPRPIPSLLGIPFERLCDTPAVAGLDAPLRAALCQIVETLREDRAAKAREGGAIAQSA
jgi:DNA-binding transcriptional regulator of glucitol operon